MNKQKNKWMPKFGEKILVSDDKKEWREVIFIGYQKELSMPYFTVSNDYSVKEIKEGSYMDIFPYTYAKPINKNIPEYTMQELTEKLGHNFKIKRQ